jgi:hypothetical protein
MLDSWREPVEVESTNDPKDRSAVLKTVPATGQDWLPVQFSIAIGTHGIDLIASLRRDGVTILLAGPRLLLGLHQVREDVVDPR